MDVTRLYHVMTASPWGNRPWCPLNRKLVKLQILCGTFGKQKNSLVLPEIEARYWIQNTQVSLTLPTEMLVTGFRRDVDETFRDNLEVPSSRVKKSKKNDSSPTSSILKMGLIGCSETSVRDYNCRLCSVPEKRWS
jgi:hypothetical protein